MKPLEVGAWNDVRQRIELNSIPVPESGCFLWVGYCNPGGYAMSSFNSKNALVHRAVYKEFIGKIPEGFLVCHKCDVRCCVNPNHLFVGTHLDNHRDMTAKGRGVYLHGSAHPKAKLTEKDVIEIRRDKPPLKDIVNRFGISMKQACDVRLGRYWQHISNPDAEQSTEQEKVVVA